MLLYSGCCSDRATWRESNCITFSSCWGHGCIQMKPKRFLDPGRAFESFKSHIKFFSLWLLVIVHQTKEFWSHLGIKEIQPWWSLKFLGISATHSECFLHLANQDFEISCLCKGVSSLVNHHTTLSGIKIKGLFDPSKLKCHFSWSEQIWQRRL